MSHQFIGKPPQVERRVTPQPSYNACQYRDPRSGDYCGATTEGSAYCGSCRPKTAPIGQARYSFSEGKRGGTFA